DVDAQASPGYVDVPVQLITRLSTPPPGGQCGCGGSGAARTRLADAALVYPHPDVTGREGVHELDVRAGGRFGVDLGRVRQVETVQVHRWWQGDHGVWVAEVEAECGQWFGGAQHLHHRVHPASMSLSTPAEPPGAEVGAVPAVDD